MKKFITRFGVKLALLGLVSGLGLMFDPANIAWAQNSTDSASSVIKGLGSVLSVIIHMLTFIPLMIMSLGGDLLGQMITGDKMMEVIRPMWIFVRNIVNIAFVLVFLFLAFANMVHHQGPWSIKETTESNLCSHCY